MDCRQCNDDLTAYIDGELAVPTEEQMRLHLERCRPCRDEFQDLRDSAVFIESHVKQLEPVPEIWNNLRARIAEMPAPTGSPGFFRLFVVNRWAAAAATLAATLILAFGLWGYMQYQASQREFESYVNEYLQARTIQEQVHALRIVEAENNVPEAVASQSGTAENPFATIRPVSSTDMNPFRVEAK